MTEASHEFSDREKSAENAAFAENSAKNDGDTKTRKKIKILISAEKMFAEKGYHKTTIESIAKNAGIGKSTFYEYFASKEDILKFIVEKAGSSFFSVMVKELNRRQSSREKLKKIVCCCLALSGCHTDMMSIYGSILLSNAQPEFMLHYKDTIMSNFQRIVRNVLLEAMNSGDIAEDNADFLASLFFGLTVGGMRNFCMHIEKPPLIDVFADDFDVENYLQNYISQDQLDRLEQASEKIIAVFWNGVACR